MLSMTQAFYRKPWYDGRNTGINKRRDSIQLLCEQGTENVSKINLMQVENVAPELQPSDAVTHPTTLYESMVINTPTSGESIHWTSYIDLIVIPIFLAIFYVLSSRKLVKETSKLVKEADKLHTERIKLETEIKGIEETLSQNKLSFLEQVNSIRRAEIKAQLQNFFAPFKSLRIQSSNLYLLFALEQKAEAKTNLNILKAELELQGKELDRKDLSKEQISQCYFGTVRYFIDGNSFEKHDEEILKQIIQVGKKIVELISKNAFILKNTSLHGILGEYAAHVTTWNKN